MLIDRNCCSRLSRCDQLVEKMRTNTAHSHCTNKAPHSTTCCSGLDVVKTPGKSPAKSPRSRRRKVAAKPPPHVHKRLMLEQSTPPVCNCSELLRRLQTTINEPPEFHFTDVESSIRDTSDDCTSSMVTSRPLKTEFPFIINSTASFDEAIVIDSDDSCDEDLHSEPHVEDTQSNHTFDIQQPQNDSFQHNEDSESPKKPIDITPEPLNISIKVSLPIPKNLSITETPSPKKPQQRNNSKKSRRPRRSLNSKRRKKANNDQEVSTCNSDTMRSCSVSDEVAEVVEVDTSVEFVLQCPAEYHQDEQETIVTETTAEGIAELCEHEQRSLGDDSVEPDVDEATRSAFDESDVLLEKAQHAQATVDVEPLKMLIVKNQLPDQFDKAVHRMRLLCADVPLRNYSLTHAPTSRTDEGGDSLYSATAIKNATVENEKCRLSEKTVTEIDTPVLDESHTSENSGASTEVYAYEECSSTLVLPNVLSTPQRINTGANLPEHTELSPTVSTASNEPDLSTVHQENNTVPVSPCVRLRPSAKNKSNRVSSSRASKAVKKKVTKIRKSTLSRQTFRRPVGTSTGKKNTKFRRTRKHRIASSERLQAQTEVSNLLSSVSGRSSTNTVEEEKRLLSTEEDILVQKHTETEHVMPNVEHEQDTSVAESGPAHQLSASPCSDVSGLTEIYENCHGSPVAEDQHVNSQVVTAHDTQLPGSPTHKDDGELADLSLASNEPVSSPLDPDWVKATSSNREPLTYSDVTLRNRLEGMSANSDVNNNVFQRFCVHIR